MTTGRAPRSVESTSNAVFKAISKARQPPSCLPRRPRTVRRSISRSTASAGVLEGREGSFVLQHRGVLSADGAEIDGAIVPGSGTGELEGITGQGAITVDDDGTHRLTLEYELA
jgi:hypothetical protein